MKKRIIGVVSATLKLISVFLVMLLVHWYFFSLPREIYVFPEHPDRMEVVVIEYGQKSEIFGNHYGLWIRSKGMKAGGHLIDIPIVGDDSDVVAYLELCHLVGTDDGIKFVQPSKHEIFIPADAYLGGR